MSDEPFFQGACAPRHLIAINCHPYHERSAVLECLRSVANAAAIFLPRISGAVDVCLFWHGGVPTPEVLRMAQSTSIRVIQKPHQTNGQNLNAQIHYGIKHSYSIFFRVDADDTVTADRFVAQASVLKNGHADIVGAGLEYVTDSERRFPSIPPAEPTPRDFLENRFILHPTMALQLASIKTYGLQYWPHRLEDKAFIRDAHNAGLRIRNVPVNAGTYRVGPRARRGWKVKWTGLLLNLAFLRDAAAWHLLPYAFVLFVAQVTFGSRLLRFFRYLKYQDHRFFQLSVSVRQGPHSLN